MAIIGAGFVGSSIAYALALRDVAREIGNPDIVIHQIQPTLTLSASPPRGNDDQITVRAITVVPGIQVRSSHSRKTVPDILRLTLRFLLINII